MKNSELLLQMYILKVYCTRPTQKTMASTKLFCLHDETWAELTERAYKTLGLESFVPLNQVRLVTYNKSSDLIECSFEGREQEPLSSILAGQGDHPNLLLETRKADETFETCLPGGK